MQAYRDQYASLFNNGQGVVVIGISNDAAPAHAEWLAADDFPFLFATDNAGRTYESFGGVSRDDDRPGTRAVIIVGPDGRIAHVIPAFLQTDPRAYEELGAAVDRIAGPGGR
jgi:peroxiredoxin